jgi:threonylcarbamoyladenosine tRNA methylthiotransferase MtaB
MIPNAFIGVDVIVGARGETDELFDESRTFIDSLDIAQLHVFSYSERPGTQALEIIHAVDPQTKHARSRQLMDISDTKLHTFYAKHIGQTADVLFEHTRKGRLMHGFTENYIKVEIPYDDSPANNICQVVLAGWNDEQTALTCKRLTDYEK